MSAAARVAGKVHKWLALLMAIQILFWFVSGLFFAAVPIEWVRSEHMVAEQRPVPIPIGDAAAGLQRVATANAAPGERIELRTLLGRPVALVSAAEAEMAPLVDLVTSRSSACLPGTPVTGLMKMCASVALEGRPLKLPRTVRVLPS